MKLSIIPTGRFKLDGGAMFGIVPRRLWERLNPPDDHNMCTWYMNAMLVETGDRKILIDTGIGNKQDDKFRSHFEPHGEESLSGSLAEKGIKPGEITDVFLTHLHFDHCGGAIQHNPESGKPEPAFSNARYWSTQGHFDWAMNPNAKEKASFLKENFLPLQEWGVLNMIEEEKGVELIKGFNVEFAYGHTEAMMLPRIQIGNQTVVYCADLMPSHYHVGMPYVMAYDIRPLDTLKEKAWLLENAVEQNWILIMEHDPECQAIRVVRNEKGRIVVGEKGGLEDLLSA